MVSGLLKKVFSIDCVNIYLSKSIVIYLFLIDLEVCGYPTLLILLFINFKKAMQLYSRYKFEYEAQPFIHSVIEKFANCKSNEQFT